MLFSLNPLQPANMIKWEVVIRMVALAVAGQRGKPAGPTIEEAQRYEYYITNGYDRLGRSR